MRGPGRNPGSRLGRGAAEKTGVGQWGFGWLTPWCVLSWDPLMVLLVGPGRGAGSPGRGSRRCAGRGSGRNREGSGVSLEPPTCVAGFVGSAVRQAVVAGACGRGSRW